eukprot:239904-Hanusia_phi.AAC.6
MRRRRGREGGEGRGVRSSGVEERRGGGPKGLCWRTAKGQDLSCMPVHGRIEDRRPAIGAASVDELFSSEGE